MPDYRIEWAIDWPGDSPKKALEDMLLQLFGGEWPRRVDHFTVTDEDGNQTAINAMADEDEEVDQ